MDWLNAVSVLAAAVIGAAAGYLGTYKAQKAQLTEAQRARLDAKQDAAVAVLADTFGKLLRHAREFPERHRNSDEAPLRHAEAEWGRVLQDLTEPARLAIGVIRDDELRELLEETVALLQDWDWGLQPAFTLRSRPSTVHGIVSHAVACVSAWQREKPMPLPNEAFQRARDSVEQVAEEAQYAREAEEEDRQARRGGGDAAPAPTGG
jgi:hypothetical protein